MPEATPRSSSTGRAAPSIEWIWRCPAIFDAARHLVRASASRREYRQAVEVSRRRVPTATPVAVGERLRHGIVGENILVTEAIPGACSLEEYVAGRLPKLAAAERAVVRRKLIESLARLCAAVHRAGIFHNDLHAGNVLVQPETCRGREDAPLPDLHLIDLAGARLSRALGWRRSRASLVMLGASWAHCASRSDAWRFWRAYLRQRPELFLPDARLAALELVERIAKRRRRVARGRDRRSLRTNRDFYRIARRNSSGHAVADFPRDEFERLLADPDRPLQAGAHRPLKLAHRSVVVQTELPLGQGGVRVAYKRVRAKNWWKTLAFFLGRSPAMEAWYLGHALLLRGIATARPLALCESRKRGLRGDSYLATQWIDGAINLHLYGWKLARSTAAERRRRTRQAAVELGRLIGRMHAWHISHPDLKGCNLLIAERAGGLEAFLIDLDGVRLVRRLWPGARARNLGRLATSLEAHPWVTRTDRLRFLRAYLREAAPSRNCDWKGLWRAAGAASRAIIKRLKRRGRQVV